MLVNEMIFKKSDYASEEELMNMLNKQTNLLLQTNHVLTIYNDKANERFIVKFCYIDPSKPIEQQDTKFPYWLFPEEAAALFELNKLAQVEAFKQLLDKTEEDNYIDDSNFDDTDDDSPLTNLKPAKYDA